MTIALAFRSSVYDVRFGRTQPVHEKFLASVAVRSTFPTLSSPPRTFHAFLQIVERDRPTAIRHLPQLSNVPSPASLAAVVDVTRLCTRHLLSSSSSHWIDRRLSTNAAASHQGVSSPMEGWGDSSATRGGGCPTWKRRRWRKRHDPSRQASTKGAGDTHRAMLRIGAAVCSNRCVSVPPMGSTTKDLRQFKPSNKVRSSRQERLCRVVVIPDNLRRPPQFVTSWVTERKKQGGPSHTPWYTHRDNQI